MRNIEHRQPEITKECKTCRWWMKGKCKGKKKHKQPCLMHEIYDWKKER